MFVIVYGFHVRAFLKCTRIICWAVQVTKLTLDFRSKGKDLKSVSKVLIRQGFAERQNIYIFCTHTHTHTHIYKERETELL